MKEKLRVIAVTSIFWFLIFMFYCNVLTTRVSLKDINIQTNDHLATIKNTISYQGKMYISQDVLDEIFNTPVSWMSSKKTLLFGEYGEGTIMSDKIEPYYIQENFFDVVNCPMSIAGKDYVKGYQLSGNNKMSFNLDGKYDEINGIIGLDDSGNQDDTKTIIYVDGKAVNQLDLAAGDLPQDISINVSGALELVFETVQKDEYSFRDSVVDYADFTIK